MRPRQVVRHLRRRHAFGGDTDVESCIGPIGALHLGDGRLDLLRQLAADLVHAIADFRQGHRARMIELQARRDRAQARNAARFHVIDAADRGDCALDRCRHEAANDLRRRPDVDRRDRDRRAFDAWILLHRKLRRRPEPDEHERQVDDDRQHRTADEHLDRASLVSPFGFAGARYLVRERTSE